MVTSGFQDLADPSMIPELHTAKQAFLAAHVSVYGYQGWLERHWGAEVGHRLGAGQHYLDNTGAGLYTNSQIAAVLQELTSSTFGNPHSRNPSSSRSTAEVEAARELVLKFFNADPDTYYLVFTKGATEGLKMVGEYFPWAFNSNNSNNSNSSSSAAHADSDSSAAWAASCLTRTVSSGSSMSISSSSSDGQVDAADPSTPAPASHFIYTQANHKSVLGIGAYAKQHGATLHCLTLQQMQQWLAQPPGSAVPESHHKAANNGLCCGPTNRAAAAAAPAAGGASAVGGSTGSGSGVSSRPVLRTMVPGPLAASAAVHVLAPAVPARAASAGATNSSHCCGAGVTHHLVAYPAKDNYEGRIYPLDWIEQVHAKSDACNRYLVVLDAAAHAASHVLDLSAVTPDFVTLSFYKVFGYPTGLGALLIHKEAARHLRKVYFGGGSVDYCTAEDAWAVMSAPPAGLEDGTLGFLNIAALKHGFAMLDRLGGMKAVEAHVESLRSWTYQQLVGLRHSNGSPLLRMFGAHEEGGDHQGGIFQFQVLTAGGDRLPGRLVEVAATAAGLHLRTGCNCNPGRCLPNLGITPEEERARAAEGHTGPVLVVMRPLTMATSSSVVSDASTATDTSMGASTPGRAAAGDTTDTGTGADMGADGGEGGGVHHQLVPVPLPVGSVRASLGALSTFEDCFALVRFLGTTFMDFQVNDQDMLMGIKLVSVLTHKEHEVTVEARISTTSRPPAASAQRSKQREEAVSCGDFFVAVDGDDGACSSWFYQI